MDAAPLVMIVDDHEDACEMYAVYFESAGFSARAVFDGIEALRLAADLLPAAIVTDLAMPEFDGWEFVRRLKADARTAAIPIVMVSGHADQATQERAEREGCARFFAKPCIPADVEAAVRDVLGLPPMMD
jgi:CheY-like chemotaxis protein